MQRTMMIFLEKKLLYDTFVIYMQLHMPLVHGTMYLPYGCLV